ncbi:protein CIP2A homolog [Branchiostoma lanceolatum]|uniref:protein CIP2A homolog n=1 Tax=Branchiostoma lanceolatum TaxID=7740 RepID=UPI0034554A3A
MDPTSCMKGLVMAGSQFRNNRSDANILQLQRQIELMISLTMTGRSVKFFNPQQILPMECLSCLCDVIEDHHTPATLSHKTIVLLNNLASYPDIRDAMHTTFNFTSSLAVFLQYHTQSPGEPLVLQTLQLLQKLTYKSKVSYPNSYMEELIRFLISHILSHESDLTAPCLGLLANLCKNNLSIQAHVKALENVKSIYRTLIAYVSHSNQSIVVYSFSILSNLCLNEEIGEKVFNAKNIYQTFQLIFNIIVNGDSSNVRRFTCDLFIGLLKSPKIQQSVVIYEHFEACLMQVLHLITMDTESATKIFELLLSFCSVNGLRCTVCRALLNTPSLVTKTSLHTLPQIFELLLSFCSVNGLRCTVCRALLNTPSLQDPDRYQPQIHQRQITEPFFALVHWAGQSVETHDQAPLFALDLLKEVFEEVIDSGLSAQLSPRTDVVVPMAVEQLTPPCDTDGSVLKLKCLKTVKALDVLLVLCNDEAMKLQVAEAVDTKVCSTLLEHQYQHNRLGMTAGHCGMDEDWRYGLTCDYDSFTLLEHQYQHNRLGMTAGHCGMDEDWSTLLEHQYQHNRLGVTAGHCGMDEDWSTLLEHQYQHNRLGMTAGHCGMDEDWSTLLEHQYQHNRLGVTAGHCGMDEDWSTLLEHQYQHNRLGMTFIIKVCSTLLEHQYQHNRLGMTAGHCGMDGDWSEAGVDLVLHTLELMSRIKTYVANMDMMFYETLQDQRLVAFLAFSLTNDTRARVQLALRLLNQALPLPEFPAIMLGDSIAAYNAKQATERKVLNIGHMEAPGSPPGKQQKTSVNYNGTDVGKGRGKGSPHREGSVDTLIDRMNSGLEIKDVKASEIMDLYEHKLASLATKESHLQDLLEAKQLALAQADRLIAQYKSRRAQSEAEARKLASMLQDSERRSESYRDQINELRLDKERQAEDMEQLVGQNNKLQAVAEEHEQLQAAYAEQIQRVEALQRSVNAHMDEQNSLREMNEMLRRHNESLKNQIEDEKKRLTKQLKDKEVKLTEEKDKVRTLEHEKEDLETAVDKYRNELTKLEQVKKETVKKYEASIAEKDALIKTQKGELDKNAQIVAMIHNISAGVKS